MSAEIEAAQQGVMTTGEYIAHHLTYFNNLGAKQQVMIDWSVINYDTVFFSTLLAIVAGFLLWLIARRATAGVPGRVQGAMEMLVEMVIDQTKGIIHSAESRKFVAPLGLTVFLWVTLMNAMDFLPVDLLPRIWQGIYSTAGLNPHHAYLRIVPTADINAAMGMSVTVLLICLFYNIKIKGIGGWAHELVTAPFGTSKNPVLALLLGVLNFAMQLIEFVSKTFSHGMRLFGNMFAGELLFILIALMGGAVTGANLPSGLFFIGDVLAGLGWAIFHILVVVLQAFIFMMLTIVYIGQAHEGH